MTHLPKINQENILYDCKGNVASFYIDLKSQ